MISNKLYDTLKYIALVALPAIGSFWTLVGAIWGVPHTDEVVKTIVALGTLLGALVLVSKLQYNSSDEKYDGIIDPVTANTQTSTTALSLSTDEYDAANQKEVLLKVKQHDPLV